MTELVLWHVPGSRSVRVLWLLEEIGCPYRLERLSGAASFEQALHPGRSPALQDGDVRMHETGAMTEWLCETRAPQLWRAPAAQGRIGWLDWLHFAETLLHLVAARDGPGGHKRLVAALDLLADWLDGSEWLLSHFSGADCQMGYSVWMAAQVIPAQDRPALAAYLDRCLSRPAFKAETQVPWA